LQKRECLAGIIVLMDIRHPLKDLDQQMIEWAVSADLPILLLLTKADKLSQSERSKQVKMVREAILPFQGDIQVEAFSALKRTGIDRLAAKLDSWFAPNFT
jgi:probable GTP-binding protein engB